MSSRGRTGQIWIAVLALPVLLVAVYPLQVRIEEQTQTVQQQKEVLLLRSRGLLKKLSLGYDSLLSNIYWTRAVQYYGGKRRDRDPNFELLGPLLDLTTTLDPHLLVAYKFGAIFLAEPAPRGAGRPDLAVTLIRRGIVANPEEWRLWHDLGFIYYWDIKDYEKASQAYRQGSKHPKARDWMRVMAAKIAQEGGSRETSRFLWREIYESTKDPNIRKNALDHLTGLKAEEDVEQLEKLATDFNSRFRRLPRSVAEMVGAGMLRGLPMDPSGYPYILRPDGKVHLHPSSPAVSEVLRPFRPNLPPNAGF